MPVLVQNELAELENTAGEKCLLSAETVGSDYLTANYLHLPANEQHDLSTGSGELGWICVLNGQGTLNDSPLTEAHVASILPASPAMLTASSALSALWVRVPDAGRFDPGLHSAAPEVKITDWWREPVLQSEHDARTRIYVATPQLSGTTAIKGEMVTYPPGTEAPEHHHEGAEHFQFIMMGTGTAVLDGTPQQLKAGDILYNYENEPHYFYNLAENGTEFRFVEFFVPGECKTVWAPDANLCAWLPTGQATDGGKPVREIAYHVHGEDQGI